MRTVRSWGAAAVCLAALLSMVLILAACRSEPVRYKHHWECFEHEKDCNCHDTGWSSSTTPPTLCQKNYECCIWKSNSFSGPEPTCECWNPSQSGPSCESQLPKGRDSLFENRVEKCE